MDLQSVLESIADLVFVIDQDDVFVDAWAATPTAFFQPKEQFIGKALADVLPAHVARLGAIHAAAARAGKGPQSYEYALQMRGELRHYEAQLTLREDRLVNVVVRDISDRRRAEDALRQSEERFARFMQHLPGPAWIKTLDGRYVYVNDAAELAFGRPRAAIYGRTDEQLFSRETAHRFRENDHRAAERDGGLRLLESLVHSDGAAHTAIVDKFPIAGPDGSPQFVAGVATDVTDLLRAEEKVRQVSAFQETVIRTAAEGICVCAETPAFPFVEFSVWNDRMTALTGYTREEINRLGWYQSLYPDPEVQAQAIERMGRMRHGDDLRREAWTITRKDGARRTIEISTSLVDMGDGRVHVAAMMDDVTERKRAETTLLQAQKLESLGILAAGIAHDFNNLLTSVLGHASLALGKLPADAPSRDVIEEIERTALRAARLTNQLLAYAGRGDFVIETIDLLTLVQDTVRMMERTVARSARVRLALEPSRVHGDATQLRQIILNLVTNAADALVGGGDITIRTGTRAFAPDELQSRFLTDELAAGDYAFLEVSDTGCGMTDDVLTRIFDPFYSTKPDGRGLGLSAALGIVRAHHGTIHVTTEPGAGTTFRVMLPVAPALAEPAAEPAVAIHCRGRGTILVVDDDESVRSFVRRALSEAGYRVLVAASGAEALTALESEAAPIDAAVIDFAMPVMDGPLLVRRLRERGVAAPVLMVSGFPQEEVSERSADLDLAGILEKPVRPGDLVGRIETAVGAPRTATDTRVPAR